MYWPIAGTLWTYEMSLSVSFYDVRTREESIWKYVLVSIHGISQMLLIYLILVVCLVATLLTKSVMRTYKTVRLILPLYFVNIIVVLINLTTIHCMLCTVKQIKKKLCLQNTLWFRTRIKWGKGTSSMESRSILTKLSRI